MKLKVQQVFDATVLLANIISQGRPMPQKGKYRIARMHAKLLPEFQPINAQRDELIKSYGFNPNEANKDLFEVPADKMADFQERWKVIADEEIDVEVEPIPLEQLDLGDAVDGSIHAAELVALGDLVKG